MITGHPGLGSDPPKRVGLGKGSHTVDRLVLIGLNGRPVGTRKVVKLEPVGSGSLHLELVDETVDRLGTR